MRVFVDVFNAIGERQGEGAVMTALSASVKRVLDGAGTINLTFPATDTRALRLIRNESRVVIYVEQDDERREFGRGVIRRIETENAETFTASGADSLDALKRKSVLLNRVYTNQSIGTIVGGLVSLVPGWSVTVESGVSADLQSARFDGASVLKSLVRVCEEKGIHFREGTELNTVEVGEFGSQSNVVVTNVSSFARELYRNKDVVVIDKLKQLQDSDAIANWIIPLGAGEGQAALTLQNATRTTPYTIGTITGPDGQTLYYLSDATSNEEYGQIEKIVTFKEIGPVANSTAAKTYAANALYDAASQWLLRNCERQVTYSVSGVKVQQRIYPGDKIRLVYKGVAETADGTATPVDVNDWFWVLSVNEKIADSGMTVDLEISSVDQMAKTTESIIVGALETVEAKNVSVQTFPVYWENTWFDFVEKKVGLYGGRDATFKLEIDSMVTEIVSVRIRFKTRPLYTLVDIPTTYQAAGSDIGYCFHVTVGEKHPKGLQLWINGVDVSAQFGGPWNPLASDNNAIDVTADITDIIKAAGLYQEHSIVFIADEMGGACNPVPLHPVGLVCGESSNGVIELSIRGLGIAQAIAPS